MTLPASTCGVIGELALTEIINYISPVGSVTPFFGMVAPSGWVNCDGAEYSRFGVYSALFLFADAYPGPGGLIGPLEPFGYGNGVDTFTVPDLRGQMIVGWNINTFAFNSIGNKGGEITHLLTSDESGIRAHTHPPNGAPYFAGHDAAAWKWFPGSGSAAWVAPSANMAHTGSNATADAGAAHNNLPPYTTLNWIIRAAGPPPSAVVF
jgi:microcystin-dependent protein